MSEFSTTIVEVTVPHLAETLVSATVGKWLKQPGDRIQEYDVICELLTDKVNVEMPSPVAGKLLKIIVGEGETADVGAAICLVETSDASDAAIQEGVHESLQAAESGSGSTHFQAGSDHQRYSPAVLKLAQENGIHLQDVTGTGLNGRITRKDILHILEQGVSMAKPPVKSNEAAASKPQEIPLRSTGLHLSETPKIPKIEVEKQSESGKGEYLIDVTPIRNTIASKMRQSVTEIPHAWTMIEVDVTDLVLLRSKLKDDFIRKEGVNLTYLAFVLKAVVNAIKDYPIMNSVWAVDKIIVKKDINISLAVGTEEFVVTPVIKKADQLNVAGLAFEIDSLTKKARTGKLNLNDLQGGTFTVNNTGSFGSILSYPIINYPQAAILTFESIVKKPVVIQDMIAVRSMANLCLSLDHRILDGVICGRFLQRVKENLESYKLDTKLY